MNPITPSPFFITIDNSTGVLDRNKDRAQELAENTMRYLTEFIKELLDDDLNLDQSLADFSQQLSNSNALEMTRNFVSEIDTEMTPQELLETTNLLETLGLYVQNTSLLATHELAIEAHKITSEWFPVKKMCEKWQKLLILRKGVRDANDLTQATIVGALASYFRSHELSPSTLALLKAPRLVASLELPQYIKASFEKNLNIIRKKYYKNLHSFWESTSKIFFLQAYTEFLERIEMKIQASSENFTPDQLEFASDFFESQANPPRNLKKGLERIMKLVIILRFSSFDDFQASCMTLFDNDPALRNQTPEEKERIISIAFTFCCAPIKEELSIENLSPNKLEQIILERTLKVLMEQDETEGVLKGILDEKQTLIEKFQLIPEDGETLEQALARRLEEYGEQIETLDLDYYRSRPFFLPLEGLEHLTQLHQIDLRGNLKDHLLTPLEEIQARIPRCNIITD